MTYGENVRPGMADRIGVIRQLSQVPPAPSTPYTAQAMTLAPAEYYCSNV